MSDAAACLFPGFDGETVPDWLKRLLAEGLGGVVLYGQNIRDPEQVAELTASLRAERPELIVATDEEGGDVTRLEAGSGSSFPGNFALGAVDDPALTRRVGAAIGGELAAVGIDLDLAPVADVLVDPASAIVGVRSFGSDPQLVARQVAAFVEGLQSVGVAACAKHFPGHGETVADSHLELPSSEAGLDVLRERALPPFAAAIEAGVRAVMTAHIRFGAFGEAPATWNSAVVELLRTELGFDGVVMTDALEMQGAGGPEGVDHSAVRALAAGADALCLGAALTPEQVEGVHRGGRRGACPRSGWPRPLDASASLQRGHRRGRSQDREAGAEAARRALRVEGDPAVERGTARRRAPGRAVDRGRRVRPRSRRAARRRDDPPARGRLACRRSTPAGRSCSSCATRTGTRGSASWSSRRGRGRDRRARVAARCGAGLRGDERPRPGEPRRRRGGHSAASVAACGWCSTSTGR